MQKRAEDTISNKKKVLLFNHLKQVEMILNVL